jgi:DNA polymerase
MKILSCDIETFSPVDLRKSGVYPYAAHPDFEILLFAYSIDGGPVRCIDVQRGEEIPPDVIAALTDPDAIKTAFNAAFERTCLARHFNRPMPPEQWRCTSVLALTMGLPGNLGDVGKVIGLPQDKQKMGVGGGLIRYFCIPCKPTAKNGERTRNFPGHDPERWALFKEYCARDVEVEMTVRDKLVRWAPNDNEQTLWALDQAINDRGVLTDRVLIEAAIELDDSTKAQLTEQFVKLTGITKATQVAKLKKWLEEEHEIEVESLNKASVKDILAITDEAAVTEALRLRQELSKSSVAKYKALARYIGDDDRVRGMFQFYGANRTGRWCLAEGTAVLVKTLPGEVLEKPIEEVLGSDLVWDGTDWVTHEGVVFSGDKNVIEWDEVTATPEHVVWVSSDEKMPLGDAKLTGRKLWRGEHVFDLQNNVPFRAKLHRAD